MKHIKSHKMAMVFLENGNKCSLANVEDQVRQEKVEQLFEKINGLHLGLIAALVLVAIFFS